jgi:hypothetical protein
VNLNNTMMNPVAGHSNLYKDEYTGIIISREDTERQRYRIAKQQALLNISAQQEIQNLKSEMSDIKSLLQQLINK